MKNQKIEFSQNDSKSFGMVPEGFGGVLGVLGDVLHDILSFGSVPQKFSEIDFWTSKTFFSPVRSVLA